MQGSLPNPGQTPPTSLLPTQPLGVGDLIDRSFRLYRLHFKAFLYTAALLMLPLALITAIFTQGTMQTQMGALQSLLFEGATSDEALEALSAADTSSGLFFLQFLLSIASAVALFITYLALTQLAIRTLRGDQPSVSLAFRGARENFWRALRMGILAVLAFLGIAILASVIYGIVGVGGAAIFGGLLSGIDSGASEMGAALAVFVMLCCLVPLSLALVAGPFIYLGARWTAAAPALVDQGLGARDSLRTSWRLTKGSVWRIIGFLLLIYILSFVLFAVPYYIVQTLSLVLLGGQNLWIGAVIALLFGTLLQIVWSPMTAIFPVLLYFDLRLRSSGGDIGSRLDRLEASIAQPAVATPYTYTPAPAPAIPSTPDPSTPEPSTQPARPSSWESTSTPPSDPFLDLNAGASSPRTNEAATQPPESDRE